MKNVILALAFLALLTGAGFVPADQINAQGVGDVCDRPNHCEPGLTCQNGVCVDPSNNGSSQEGLVPCGNPGQAQCEFIDLFRLLHNILEFAIFQLAPILATLMVAVGGFLMLTAAGNAGRFAKGIDFIKNALIGYLIVLASWLIVNTVLQQLGVADWTGLGTWYEITF